MELSNRFFQERKLQTLVENQTSYNLEHAEMHVFETHEKAESVLLKFDQPVLASMISGKKVMHLHGADPFEFYPGESLIMPSNELMRIDFPEANSADPTRCLAMTIDEYRIKQVLDMMNETMPKADQVLWGDIDGNFHFSNDQGIYQIIKRLLFLCTEKHPSIDLFVNNMLVELIVRIMQTNSLSVHRNASADMKNNNRISAVINYIHLNIEKNFTVEELSRIAHMSESNFYKVFKHETGMSPVNYVNIERIRRAMELLRDPNVSVKEVYLRCGFQNRSYFNRLFRKVSSQTPNEYQLKMVD